MRMRDENKNGKEALEPSTEGRRVAAERGKRMGCEDRSKEEHSMIRNV